VVISKLRHPPLPQHLASMTAVHVVDHGFNGAVNTTLSEWADLTASNAITDYIPMVYESVYIYFNLAERLVLDLDPDCWEESL